MHKYFLVLVGVLSMLLALSCGEKDQEESEDSGATDTDTDSDVDADADADGDNQAPLAEAGEDQTVPTGTPVSLNGSGSNDPDGDSLTYLWSIDSMPTGSATQISDESEMDPGFIPDVDGDYVLSLVVNDGQLDSQPDTLTVTAQNEAPVAEAGNEVNVLTGSTANLDGSGSTDPNGDSLTYSWTLQSAPVGSTADLVNPSDENPTLVTDLEGEYVLELVVNDGQVDSAADAVSVTAGSGPQLMMSTDLGAPQIVYHFETGTEVHYLNLHSNAAGDLTVYLDRAGEDPTIMSRPAGGAWSSPTTLATTASSGEDTFLPNFVETDTLSGTFTDAKLMYSSRASTTEPYGPDTVYFNDLSTTDDVSIYTSQIFYTDTSSSFYTSGGNNFFEDGLGNLHAAIVDNFELFYLASTDAGATWSSEQVVTGYEGDIRAATMVLDHDGDVFIGFSVNELIGYANPTGVTYSHGGEIDLHCAHNTTGTWTIEPVQAHTGNYGPWVLSAQVDASNNVSLFAVHYWWFDYGGEAWEYVRNATSGTWGGEVEVVSYNDTAADRSFYLFMPSVTAGDGTVTLFLNRYRATPTGTDDQLVYVQKSSGLWGSPVELDTPNRAYAGSRNHDAAIDGNDHIYAVYMKDPI